MLDCDRCDVPVHAHCVGFTGRLGNYWFCRVCKDQGAVSDGHESEEKSDKAPALKLVTLEPPCDKDPWPILPAVLRELDVGHPEWTLRCSYVSLLLVPICAGMPSDATLRDVLLRVRDADALRGLLACAELDDAGIEYPNCDFRMMLLQEGEDEGEPLLLDCERGGRESRHAATMAMRSKFKYGLRPFKRLLRKHRFDPAWIGTAARQAANERDVVSFREIMRALPAGVDIAHCRLRDLDLGDVVHAIGEMYFSGDDGRYDALDKWLGPIYRVTSECQAECEEVFNLAYGGQRRATFERVLWHMIHYVLVSDGSVLPVCMLCQLYEAWMAPALCTLWRKARDSLLLFGTLAADDCLRWLPVDEEGGHSLADHPEWREAMRRLMRTTVAILRIGFTTLVQTTHNPWWRHHAGWLVQAVAECCPHGDPILAIATFAQHDNWRVYTADGHHLRAWRLGWILWRIQLQRNQQFCFTEWLDSADAYAPTDINAAGDDGTAPRVAMDAYTEDFAALASDPPPPSLPPSLPPSPPESEAGGDEADLASDRFASHKRVNALQPPL